MADLKKRVRFWLRGRLIELWISQVAAIDTPGVENVDAYGNGRQISKSEETGS